MCCCRMQLRTPWCALPGFQGFLRYTQRPPRHSETESHSNCRLLSSLRPGAHPTRTIPAYGWGSANRARSGSWRTDPERLSCLGTILRRYYGVPAACPWSQPLRIGPRREAVNSTTGPGATRASERLQRRVQKSQQARNCPPSDPLQATRYWSYIDRPIPRCCDTHSTVYRLHGSSHLLADR